MIEDERLRIEFNDWARAGRGVSMERGHRPAGEQAIARLNLETDSRVIDLGCGSGWATRLMAERANRGRVVGIDISDEMIALARISSAEFSNVEFQIGSAENLPFGDGEFTHAFSMESIYYYANMPQALSEIRRVLAPNGIFATVVDLYQENEPSHQWIAQLKVPVQFLSIEQYHELFTAAGFVDVFDERLYDPTPIPEDYTGGSFKSRADYMKYREAGSLLITGRVKV
ncbi:MAG: methyltransferase domain-containing protein [Pyrinomonadaceae bacterium]|nr:methyltransferase domain-containing protein [Pyrinomonadaceae bacterium]